MGNMKQFSDYFSKQGKKINVTDIHEQIKNVSKILFLSALDKHIISFKNTSIQHYIIGALDFLLTQDFKIKFLEFNVPFGSYYYHKNNGTDICFQEKETMFGKQIVFNHNNWKCIDGKRIMEEMINIQIEIAIKKQNGQKLDKLESVNTFQPIIWK